MVGCLLPDCELPPYDQEPGVIVSFVHTSIGTTHSLAIGEVVRRFLVNDADVGPAVWGPPAWRLVHGLADSSTGYHHVPRLLEAWLDILPCTQCRHHLGQHLGSTHAPTHDTQQSMQRFVEDLHNSVNQSIGKSIFTRK